jgi:hypothetical protein
VFATPNGGRISTVNGLYVHTATLVMDGAADPAAPGAAITRLPPCRSCLARLTLCCSEGTYYGGTISMLSIKSIEVLGREPA